VSGVTYGGQALTLITKQNRSGSSVETGCIYLYFLGSGVPAGAQTVSVTSTGTLIKSAGISTVTCATDTVVDSFNGGGSASLANPSLALTFSGTLESAAVYYALGNGASAVFTTVEAGSTHQFGQDHGADVAVWARKQVSNAASTTIGYTAAADDVTHAGLVVTAA
jgi:hypothetical protein